MTPPVISNSAWLQHLPDQTLAGLPQGLFDAVARIKGKPQAERRLRLLSCYFNFLGWRQGIGGWGAAQLTNAA
jgi:hypothetical protein